MKWKEENCETKAKECAYNASNRKFVIGVTCFASLLGVILGLSLGYFVFKADKLSSEPVCESVDPATTPTPESSDLFYCYLPENEMPQSLLNKPPEALPRERYLGDVLVHLAESYNISWKSIFEVYCIAYGEEYEAFNSDPWYEEWGSWEDDPIVFSHPFWKLQAVLIRTRRRSAIIGETCSNINDVVDSELYFVDLEKVSRDVMAENCHALGGWMWSPTNVNMIQLFFREFSKYNVREFWFGWGCNREDRSADCVTFYTNDPAEPIRGNLSVNDNIWNYGDGDIEPDRDLNEKCTASYLNQDGYLFNLRCDWDNAYICAFK